MPITPQQLLLILPNARQAAGFVPVLNTAMGKYQIITSARIGAFIAPLQYAVDLYEAAEAETSLLEKWKQYRVAVNRIDLTFAEPSWPAATA